MRCALLSPSEGLSSVGPKTVARLWRDILLIGSFSATLWGTGREGVSAPNAVQGRGSSGVKWGLRAAVPSPSSSGAPPALHCPLQPSEKPGAGQGALPPSRPPPEPPGLAGSPGCDVAATKPSLAYPCGASALAEPAGHGALHQPVPPAPTPLGAPCPDSPVGALPASREAGPQHCHVRRQLCSPAQAARLSPGQGSRCGNWLCPVLRMETDFSFSIPQHQSLFLFGFSQTRGTKKTLHDASNMSREPQSQALARLCVLLCCPPTALCLPWVSGPQRAPVHESPGSDAPHLRQDKACQTTHSSLTLGQVTRAVTCSSGTCPQS